MRGNVKIRTALSGATGLSAMMPNICGTMKDERKSDRWRNVMSYIAATFSNTTIR